MIALFTTIAGIILFGFKIWYKRYRLTPRQRLLDTIEKRHRERNIVREQDSKRLSYIDYNLLNRVESLLREKRNKRITK